MNKYNRLNKFFEFCAKHNIELDKSDLSYLNRLTSELTGDALKNILILYAKVWKEEMGKEGLPHRKQNKGRVAANTWIREYIAGKCA